MTAKNRVITYLLALYCCLMPFEEALASSFGSILKIIGMLLIAYVIIQNRGNWFLSKYQGSLILWTIYMFVSVTWVSSVQWWQYFFRIYIVQIIFLCAMEMVPVKSIDMKVVRKSLILGGCIASAIMILFPTSSGFTDEGRRTIMLLESALDPNVVASIILLGAQVSIGEFYKAQRRSIRFVLLAIWQILGILLTGSRGALLAFVVGFSIEIILNLFNEGERRKALRVFLLGIVAVIFIIGILPENLLQTRFSKENILGLNELASGSHNRYTIWMYAGKLIKNNPVFGYGCGNFFSAIATVYRTCASHNLYVLLMVEGGLIGMLLFGRYVWKILKGLFRQQDFSTFALLLTVLIMAFSLDSITYKYFWMALIYSRLIIRENIEHKYDEE
ncbi:MULTISPECIES: O-antigen ligase family protein [Blautia]|uniref:O-antigen ligase family protein n=1 Tax=Blautia TaxID=572511 RepID=UPI000BA4950D|nr:MULTISPECIES: O-antigen ligase family protein [Blautia]